MSYPWPSSGPGSTQASAHSTPKFKLYSFRAAVRLWNTFPKTYDTQSPSCFSNPASTPIYSLLPSLSPPPPPIHPCVFGMSACWLLSVLQPLLLMCCINSMYYYYNYNYNYNNYYYYNARLTQLSPPLPLPYWGQWWSPPRFPLDWGRSCQGTHRASLWESPSRPFQTGRHGQTILSSTLMQRRVGRGLC